MTQTPTPWRVEPEKLYRGSHVAGRTPRVVGNGTLIANIWNPEDAALIVRAVNSYEAMREALESIAQLPVHPADDARNQSCLEAALGFAKVALREDAFVQRVKAAHAADR